MNARWLPGTLVVALGLSLVVSAVSHAAPALVTSRVALAGSEFIDWAQLSGTVANPAAVVSNTAATTATVSNPTGNLERLDQFSGWNGNFGAGDVLLFTYYSVGPMVIEFAAPVTGAGAQIQSDHYGSFTAQIDAFDASNTLLASFTLGGDSTADGDNSAIFIGVLDTAASIKRIEYSVDGTSSDFAINRLDLRSLCGNGALDPGEECDDGNAVDSDGCTNSCTICGNGTVTVPEQCDDGNLVDSDGCDSNCTLPFCGNRIVDAGEQCDDGNHVNDDGCEVDCTLPSCGNGIVDAGEECDDGNHVNGDGCETDCTLSFCGNGIVDAGEQCDDGNNVSGDGCDPGCVFSVGLHVRVQASGGSPIADADVVLIDSDGTRFSAVSGSDGVAFLTGVPDGEYTVYAWAPGYLPDTAQVTIANASGIALVTLRSGDLAMTGLESDRLTRDEIIAAGIDPDDPDNQNVFQFEVHLLFGETGVSTSLTGYIGSGDPGGGGGSEVGTHFVFPTTSGGDATCTEDMCLFSAGNLGGGGGGGGGGAGSIAVGIPHVIEGQPSIFWLVIPGKASWLKEFFSIRTAVTNLASTSFTFTNGSVTLQLPSGLSLAPTATPQSLTVPMADIPGQSTGAAEWVIRGDEAGEYDLSTLYSGVLAPFGRNVQFTAQTPHPLKVWGGDALEMIVDADAQAYRGYPYRVRIGLHNVTAAEPAEAADVFNPAVELLDQGRLNFIWQPLQPRSFATDVIHPGDTFWTDDIIVVPSISGILDVSGSFVAKTAGNVDVASHIQSHPPIQDPSTAPVLQVTGAGQLTWGAVPGAERYQVFKTPAAAGADPFPTQDFPATAIAETTATSATVTGMGAGQVWYAISAVIGGKNVMFHPIIEAQDGLPGGFVPPDKSTLRCEGGVATRLRNFRACIERCHIKAVHAAAVHASFDVQGCETTTPKTSCRAKFDAAVAKLVANGLCPACLDATRQAALASELRTSLDGSTGALYCAGTSPLGGGLTGFVPPDAPTLACEGSVAKNAALLAKCVARCHIKAASAAYKGMTFDEGACESTDPAKSCRAKYAAKVSQLVAGGACPACLGAAQQNTAADEIESALEISTGDVYCAGTVALP